MLQNSRVSIQGAARAAEWTKKRVVEESQSSGTQQDACSNISTGYGGGPTSHWVAGITTKGRSNYRWGMSIDINMIKFSDNSSIMCYLIYNDNLYRLNISNFFVPAWKNPCNLLEYFWYFNVAMRCLTHVTHSVSVPGKYEAYAGIMRGGEFISSLWNYSLLFTH